MTSNPKSDFKRNLSREIAAYFIVVLCALPIRFWLMSEIEGAKDGFGYFWNSYLSGISLGLIGVVFVSKLSLRTKLILTFVLVAI
jgi:FtsH-binding integral membrane protein